MFTFSLNLLIKGDKKMIELKHVITDELGMHARPAGQLVKMCGAYECSIQIGTQDKMVDASRIFRVMSLALKQGDEFTMTFDGSDEAEAAGAVEAFLRENV